MIISSMFCESIHYLKLSYNRNLNKIILLPCCGTFPKSLKEPFAFDPIYFINNISECIDNWKNINLANLSNYYNGYCVSKRNKGFIDDGLCNTCNLTKNIKNIELSISHMCNLKCKMCTVKKEINVKEQELYKALLEFFKNKDIEKIGLTCEGEPLLYKKETIDFFEHSKAKTISITTNGLLLDDDYLKILSKHKNRLDLTVSVDSLIKQTYEKIRIGGKFETIENNLNKLIDLEIPFKINFVLQDLNFNEYFEFKKYFNNKNINVIRYFLWDKSKELINKLNGVNL